MADDEPTPKQPPKRKPSNFDFGIDHSALREVQRLSRMLKPWRPPAIPNYQGMLPKVDFPQFPDLPTYKFLLPDFAPLLSASSLLEQFTAFKVPTALEQITRLLGDTRTLLDDLLDQISREARPPNWTGLSDIEVIELNLLVVDEGIPVMWVPRVETLKALLDANSAIARRNLIGSRWRSISIDCLTVLESIQIRRLRQHVNFAASAVEALRNGHSDAAQALAANLLDTILKDKHLEPHATKIRDNWPDKKPGFKLADYRFKEGMTFAPVFRAHVHYKPKKDPVPRYFARHASAHTVGRLQYCRVNAVYGIMIVTSLLKFLDDAATQ
ncbi:hypothetical protein [Glycomyces sp. YM15]|uniref:hypothetical protein n=1 Tax=Glycomyces sp. YM15 TaxID=2800446 RepID=UPI001966929E|nr:hypothetical protein [Glycomyces sp. YM15]